MPFTNTWAGRLSSGESTVWMAWTIIAGLMS